MELLCLAAWQQSCCVDNQHHGKDAAISDLNAETCLATQQHGLVLSCPTARAREAEGLQHGLGAAPWLR